MSSIRRALQYFRDKPGHLIAIALLMLSNVALNLLKPWPIAIILDSILGERPLPFIVLETPRARLGYLPVLVLTILLLHLAQGAAASTQNFLSIKVSLHGLARIRSMLFEKLQRLSQRFYHNASMGDLVYRATWDTFAFQTFFQQGIIISANAVLSLVLMTLVMSRLNGRLTLAALCVAPVVIVVIRILGKTMAERARLAQAADSKVTSLVQQAIASMQLIQSYNRERQEKKAFAQSADTAQQARVSQHGAELIYGFGVTAIFGAGTALVAFLGTREVLSDHLTVGQLIIFLTYLNQLYEPLNQLSQAGTTVSGANAGIGRVFEILDEPEEIADEPQARPLKISAAPAIEFQHVSFSYRKGAPVLRDINLSIRAGERIAIVGPSGAGKTTLINLLPRFFDPTSGTIKIGEINLPSLRLEDVRATMGLVLQQPVILPATIAENIAYGKAEATQEEIERAAQAANAHEFIMRHPKGYQAMIGDSGLRLSLGEQQRLNLARAFLKDAPVLLLDEPTSALDLENERMVVASLQRLMKGRTTLMVAHRASTIRDVDRIIVLEDGIVTAMGNHAETTKESAYYRAMMEFR